MEPFRSDLKLDSDDDALDLGRLRDHYSSTIQLLAAIAERQGFVRGWVYGDAGN